MSEETRGYKARSDEFGKDPAERPYHLIALDPEKDTEEYNVNERRAALLERLREVGLPSSISRTEMGERFGVSHTQIHYDLEVLKDWLANHLDIDHEAEAYTVFTKARKELMSKGDYKDAVKVQREMSEWLEDRGAVSNESEGSMEINASDVDVQFNVVSSEDEEEDEE